MRDEHGSIRALVGASVVMISMLTAGAAFAADAPKVTGMTTAPGQPCATGQTGAPDASGKPQCDARTSVMPSVGGVRHTGGDAPNSGAARAGVMVHLGGLRSGKGPPNTGPACAKGQVATTNPTTGQPSCADSGKHISDGAAKGQATE